MRKRLIRGAAAAAVVASVVAGAVGRVGHASAAVVETANGSGKLDLGQRTFSFNAKRNDDGSVNGQATLINRSFSGENGQAPYQLNVDISCMHVVGNIAIFGGTTKRTNDPNLVDAVFFSVEDNGEPGKGRDKISRVFFWDDDPSTTGDPQACLLTGPADFQREVIESGNIQVS